MVGVSAAGASTEAEHLSAELGFEVLVPGNPPAGYILRSVSKSVLGGLEIADFRYVDDTGSGGGSNVDVQEINTRLTQPPMVSGSTPSVVADPALPWANVMVSRGPSGGATVYAIRSGDRTFVVAIDRGNALTLSAVNSMAAPFVAAVS